MAGHRTDVWVLGGYQSDFARNLHREGADFADLFGELVRETLADAEVPAQAVGVVHVGNALGQLFTGQGHLGAMPATVDPDLWAPRPPGTSVSDSYLDSHPEVGRHRLAKIQGWGHRTVALGLQQKLDRSADSEYEMPHRRLAVQEAFARAHVDIEDIDGLETHDCFTPSEYLAIDHVGITGRGEGWKAIENGDLEIGGRFPVNPSGGPIGGGHPVGATGLRMLLDASRQGHRPRRRVPGRGRRHLRHSQHRRLDDHHREFRRGRSHTCRMRLGDSG